MGMFSILVLSSFAGIRLNTSDSIPKGIYRIHQGAIEKNSLVLFCPDDREAFRQGRNRGYLDHGFCSGDYGYLMKKIAAVSGDVVSSTKDGVYVNHSLLSYSKPQIHDGLHRPLTFWRVTQYTLKPQEVLTMTNQSIMSFDGRYYGLIQTKQIKGIITPVLTW
jgi:conjugative transfer signal peptidase TraF